MSTLGSIVEFDGRGAHKENSMPNMEEELQNIMASMNPTVPASEVVGTKKIDAVVCEACGRLHKYTNSTWITLFGAWKRPHEAPYDRRSHVNSRAGHVYGTSDNPTVVCDDNSCILKVMGREGADDY